MNYGKTEVSRKLRRISSKTEKLTSRMIFLFVKLILVAVLLMAAFAASLLRNLLGLGSLMAFPGSMIGALLAGITYWKTRSLFLTLVAEVFGTGILGGLCAYPVAVVLMGQSAGSIAFYAYIIPFLVSTVGGSILSGVILYALRDTGAWRRAKAALQSKP